MTKRVRCPSVRVMLLWLLSALLIGAFAACTQATDAGIPTASDSQAAPSGETNSAQGETDPAAEDPEDRALAYSQCMRENGVPEFPDPDSEGRILMRLGSVNPDSAGFQKARDACLHLAPAGWGEANRSPEDEELMLEFARCLRENGVPDFPDPDPNSGSGIRITVGPDSDLDPNDPKVRAALDICHEMLPGLPRGG